MGPIICKPNDVLIVSHCLGYPPSMPINAPSNREQPGSTCFWFVERALNIRERVVQSRLSVRRDIEPLRDGVLGACQRSPRIRVLRTIILGPCRLDEFFANS